MNIARSFAQVAFGLVVALVVPATAFGQTAPVTITTQPASRSVTIGAAASFTVAATGNPAPTYQWRKNGLNIGGATTAVFSLPTTGAGDAATYTVVVSNSSGSVTSNGAVLTVNAKADVTVKGPGGVAAGETATFTAVASGGTPPFTYQWYKNGLLPANIIAGATSATYTTPAVTVPSNDKDNYYVRITDASGIVTESAAENLTVFPASQTITFTPPNNPVVSPTPIALTATASSGLAVTFSVTSGSASVSGNSLTLAAVGSVTVRASQVGNVNYNPATPVDRTFTVAKGTPVITWPDPTPVVDGTILGASQLNATANVAGTFVYSPSSGAVHVPSLLLSVTFTPTSTANYNTVTVQRTITVNPVTEAHLTNVSVRTTLAVAQTLIVGFTMQGGAKPVLIRAIGPGLIPFSVPGTMADPRMAVFKDTTQVDANDNWGGGSALSTAFASVGAFVLAAGSLDAALLRSVDGGYSAQIAGPAGTVLVEVYDAGSGSSPHLTNVSARNRVGTGSDILIAGFTIAGSGQKNLLIRAVGPALSAFGVTGTLADPKLELFSGSAKIAENDSWSATLAGTFSSVGAFALASGSKDAALTIILPAGSYTVQVSGADGGTGEALVEVYELP